jgi:choline dehydrogenase-like flavoprotein
MKRRIADAVIVGSGPGGSTLAHGLTQRGARVVVVERGDFLRPDPARAGEPSIYIADAVHRSENWVGGPSKFYGASLYRLREMDFAENMTELGESPAWPLTYDDLEPFYCEGERLYEVHGSTEGDLTEPYHSSPYPGRPIEHESYIRPIVERISARGLPVSYLPKAIDFGPTGRCILCPRCDGHYCQLDAKMDAEIAALRPALETGLAEVLTGTECLQVLTTPDGRRTRGVRVRRRGEELTIDAGIVAVSGGHIGSPLLLRRSRSVAHPEGIGNAAGCLGRYLAGHSAGLVFAARGLRRWPELHQKTFAINAFYASSPGWPYPTGVIQAAGQLPVWKTMRRPLAPLVRALAERSLCCFLMSEVIPQREAGLQFDGDRLVGVKKPQHPLETYSRLRRLAIDIFKEAGLPLVVVRPRPGALWHPVGTVRIGADPATSVLDPTCRVHGMENLYVVDSSVLPTAGAVNTTLTVIAIALKVASELAGDAGAQRAGEEREPPSLVPTRR